MNQRNLLAALKSTRDYFAYYELDPLINKLELEIKQEECPHLETKTEMGSCFYGEYKTTVCLNCRKIILMENNW